MADFSVSVTKAQAATSSFLDVTVGTSSPGAGQMEFRVDLTTVPASRRDVLLFLDKLEAYFTSNVEGVPNPIPNVRP